MPCDERVLNRKTSWVMMVAAALVAVFSVGCAASGIKNTPLDEPPALIVQSGNMGIGWVVGKNKWNGSVYDRPDDLQCLMADKTIDDLDYVKNGEQITFKFDGIAPDSFVLTEYILRENGDAKYNIYGMEYDICSNPGGHVFTVKPNYATAFSSSSWDYAPGNTIKGYRLVCSWGRNECEYAFIIRGDAAITM